MSFSFDATAGASQSTSIPQLPGNEIYDVKFEKCTIDEFTGKQDPSQVYKVIKLRFSNDDGYYEHTIFEPRPEDFKRGENEFTNKNGNTEKIPQASNVESMMLLFKHAIDALVPKVAEAIDSGAKQLTAPDWDTLRKLVGEIMKHGEGVETKIKLINNNKGEARFPGFFAGVSREGKAYIRNNFIGNKVAFTPYELTKIQNAAAATPTPAPDLGMEGAGSEDSGLDLNFDVGGL